MKKTSSKDFIVIGFALFAMFFGAGNLIFPSFIGNLVGDKTPVAIIGFFDYWSRSTIERYNSLC